VSGPVQRGQQLAIGFDSGRIGVAVQELRVFGQRGDIARGALRGMRQQRARSRAIPGFFQLPGALQGLTSLEVETKTRRNTIERAFMVVPVSVVLLYQFSVICQLVGQTIVFRGLPIGGADHRFL
jgi:hypothetical protein